MKNLPQLANQTNYLVAQILARRKLARANLDQFILHCRRGYSMQPFHRAICSVLQGVEEGRYQRVILSVPPQHGKSEIATRHFPAYLIGRNPARKVVVSSYGGSLAESFNRDAQRVMESEEFRQLFPKVCLPGRGEAVRNNSLVEIVNEDGVPTLGSIKAVGRGAGLTGFPMDIGIIDDPLKDRAEAQSSTIRESLWSWYTDVFETRMHNDSRQLIIQTRWHEDDLAGRVLARDGHYHPTDNPRGWMLINFEAIKTEHENPFDTRQVGEALWPERHNLEKLLAVKASNITTFNSLYQGDPKPNPENLVFPNWIKVESVPYCDVRFFGLDFGFSNDPTALTEIQRSGKNLYFNELLYETHLTNPDLSRRFELMGIRKGRDEIIADSSDPRSIEELKRLGWNIRGSTKGPDSINAGINKLDEFVCHYTARSVNLHAEVTHYEWITYNGKKTNEPIDAYNHLMDGIRGAVFTKYHGPGAVRIANRR